MDLIEKTCEKLKSIVSKYEPESFIGHLNFMMQHHLKQGSSVIKDRDSKSHLRSPARQLIYIASLYLSSDKNGKNVFENQFFEEIASLANEIEDLYIEGYLNEIETFDEEHVKKLRVSSTTYLNYFVNAELNYIEQDLARIEDTFKVFDDFIEKSTGLTVLDYLDFFDATQKLELEKLQQWEDITTSGEWLGILDNFQQIDWDKFENEKPKLYEQFWGYVENPSIYLRFTIEEFEEFFPAVQSKKCLNYFSTDIEDKNFIFYTQKPKLLLKPIIKYQDHFYLFFQKQLSHSIYWHLFEVCKELDKNAERIHRRREKRLEKKVEGLFDDFFSSNARIFSNYIFNEEEKDLLILFKNMALIIEIKANKKNEPFRDHNKGFTRIKRDFKECIQKGYDQTYPIKSKFMSGSDFVIQTETGPYIINPRRYTEVFSVVVTQERYGQIQTDLGLLLEINEDDLYPWSISVDDLEVFLLTLKRKKTKISDLLSFLKHRELLHERLVCADELELCAYFIMSKWEFQKYCTADEIFVSSPDLSNLFDDLYFVGFGFENEKLLEKKSEQHDMRGKHIEKALGLKVVRQKKVE